jgi:signal transduction histidine kinase
MMMCLEGVPANPIFWSVCGVCAIAALGLFTTLKLQKFNGKFYYAHTFGALIWTLLSVGFESASTDFDCQFQWAILAWPGNAMVPIAWCFFVFAYVDHAAWLKKRIVFAALTLIPLAILAFAATNPWHKLVYTDATRILPGEDHIHYVHGPGFYVIVSILYAFVVPTLWCLAKAFKRAKRTAWPLLITLLLITITPLTANASYVILGFTIFGLDPTSFMFTLGIIIFTWMLLTNKTMDMAFVGQSALFNTMTEPVIMIDRFQNIMQMNAAAKQSGLHQKSGNTLTEILANIKNMTPSGSPDQLCIGDRIYEPRIREIESPLDPAKTILGWSITFVDITDRIAVSAALEEALQRADEASRAKDEFISVVSHELRTPLTSLTGGLSLALSGRLGEVNDPILSLLKIAHRNGLRLTRLIDNILLTQKINVNALNLESKPVNLAQLLEESLEENKMFATERGIELALKDVDRDAVVTGDAFAIRQIIDNLLSNAIKFSVENGVVEGTVKASNGLATLSITNSGRGIPAGMESQVFGRFEQVNDKVESYTQGSGLGLHISRNLAEKMLGNIFYESEEGHKTTFFATFPIAITADKD